MSFSLGLAYCVELPGKTEATLSIYNVLDEEPSFSRAALAYNAGFGSPLGRTAKRSFTQRF